MDANIRILAKVGQAVITEADVTATIAGMGQKAQAYNSPEGRRAILDQLINKQLLVAEAKRNFYEADPIFQAQLTKLKVQHAVSPIENPSIIKKNRRDIARMLTILRQKNAK